jgi:hypothetical protein
MSKDEFRKLLLRDQLPGPDTGITSFTKDHFFRNINRLLPFTRVEVTSEGTGLLSDHFWAGKAVAVYSSFFNIYTLPLFVSHNTLSLVKLLDIEDIHVFHALKRLKEEGVLMNLHYNASDVSLHKTIPLPVTNRALLSAHNEITSYLQKVMLFRYKNR